MLKTSFNMAQAMSQTVEQVALELTLSELVQSYTIAHNDQTDLILRKWMPAFGARSAWSITSDEVISAHQAMIAHGYKPASANRSISALGSCYKWAIARRITPKGFKSPTVGVQRTREEPHIVDVSDKEIERLRARSLAYPDRRFGLFVSLLIDTGARKSELLERTWAAVDTTGHQITATGTKTGKDRVLHYTDKTQTLMDRVCPPTKREPTALIFEGRVKNQPIDFRKAWAQCTKECGLPALRQHDVRHYAAARSLRAGNSAAVTAQTLGHSIQVLMARYGHLDTAAMKEAAHKAWGVAA